MLAYDDSGCGLPVVLIHGFPLNRQMWQPQVAALNSAGYRTICPDLPGFGQSPPLDSAATMSAYADSLVGLLDQLGIDRVIWGGMSMGGYVLLNLINRYSQRCRAAMFLVTRASADDAAGREKRTALAAEVDGGNPQLVGINFSKVLFAPQTPDEQPELVTRVQEWMANSPAPGLSAGLRAMRDRVDYLERLPEFDLPSLVVGAEQDLAVPMEHARLLANGLPQATLQVIAGAGHMANLEQPSRFNRILLDFLNLLES